MDRKESASFIFVKVSRSGPLYMEAHRNVNVVQVQRMFLELLDMVQQQNVQ